MEAFNEAKLKVERRITEDLGIDANLSAVLRAAGERDAIAVGHEPTLSDWIAQLCFHGKGGAGAEMKKGAIAALEVHSARSAKLLFLASPVMLRRL